MKSIQLIKRNIGKNRRQYKDRIAQIEEENEDLKTQINELKKHLSYYEIDKRNIRGLVEQSKMDELNESSKLVLSTAKTKDVNFISNIIKSEKRLPKIRSIILQPNNNSQQDTNKFIRQNFPIRLENLEIDGKFLHDNDISSILESLIDIQDSITNEIWVKQFKLK